MKYDSQIERKFRIAQKKQEYEFFITYAKLISFLLFMRMVLHLASVAQSTNLNIKLLLCIFLTFLAYYFCVKFAENRIRMLKKMKIISSLNVKGISNGGIYLGLFTCFQTILFQLIITPQLDDDVEKGVFIGFTHFLIIVQSTYFLNNLKVSICLHMVHLFLVFMSVDSDTAIALAIIYKLFITFTISIVLNRKYEEQIRYKFYLKSRLKSQSKMYEYLLNTIHQPLIIYKKDKGIIFQNEACFSSNLKLEPHSLENTMRLLTCKEGLALSYYVDMAISRDGAKFDDLMMKGMLDFHKKYVVVNISPIEFKTESETVSISITDLTQKRKLKKQKEFMLEYNNALICTFSHELRTPLNGIMGMLTSLKDDLKPQQLTLLKGAISSSTLLKYKINDILDYAQIQNRDFQLHPHRDSLENFVHNIETIVSSGCVQKCLDLNFALMNSKDNYYVDWERLTQIVLNLLTNAIKYTLNGFIRITIKKEMHYLVFKVEDSGIGMSENQKENLFNFKLGSAEISEINTHIRTSGLPGMGLTVSQMIASQMKSRIKVKSTQGKGSTFSFKIFLRSNKRMLSQTFSLKAPKSLSFVKASSSSPQEKDKNNTDYIERDNASLFDLKPIENRKEEDVGDFVDCLIPSEEKHFIMRRSLEGAFEFINPLLDENLLPFILIVDDNTMNRFVIKTLLRNTKCKMKEACNGLEAVEMATKQLKRMNPHFMIFMDIDMPILDGIEATKQIRMVGAFYPPIIIACTAFAAQQERENAFKAGINHFITKPITQNNIKFALSLFNPLSHQ
jgi:signal transduction histidine kinase/ActR/RegA family two-component response regulator